MKAMKITATIFTIAALAIGISLKCIDSSSVSATNAETKVTKANGQVEHPNTDFDKQVEDGIVILDFFATWCPPCRRFGPIFTKAAATHSDILFIKVDVDKYSSLASTYGVRSMPTIIALKDGKKIESKTGYMSNKQFESWINSIS